MRHLVAAIPMIVAFAFAPPGNPTGAPPKQFPRTPIVMDPVTTPVVPITPLQQCRRELRQGIADCKSDYANDPEGRATCLQAEVEGYKICRQKAVPAASLWIDADDLRDGFVTIYATSGIPELWVCDEDGEWNVLDLVEDYDGPGGGRWSGTAWYGEWLGTDAILLSTTPDDAAIADLLN